MSLLPTVIFDCDGVLVDSERLSHEVLRQMIGEYGTALTLQEALDHFMGTSTEKCLSVLAGVIGRPAPADFLQVFRDRTFEAFRASLKPVAGALGAIRSLESPFCVASNGPKEKMMLTLGLAGLLPHFEGRLFSAEEVARPKPAPDLFLHAARCMGASPATCVVIEDSPTGIAAAKAAGMLAIGYATMGQDAKLLAGGADVLLNDMALLPQTLRTLRSAA